ncbi:MAG: Holliday junction branch migration protein RuvA [Geminicoccaceae bacterium]
MIAQLRGTLAEAGDTSVVIDVGGVGYLVQVSSRTLRELPAVGHAVTLLVETQMREDAIWLYGFATAEERSLFRLLQSVQGVGARLALAIQDAFSAPDLHLAIAAGDKTALTRANGVGKRLAARLVTELQERIGAVGASPFQVAPAATSGGDPVPLKDDQTGADALSALVNLGYGRSEALLAVQAVMAQDRAAPLEQVIRLCLARLTPKVGAGHG